MDLNGNGPDGTYWGRCGRPVMRLDFPDGSWMAWRPVSAMRRDMLRDLGRRFPKAAIEFAPAPELPQGPWWDHAAGCPISHSPPKELPQGPHVADISGENDVKLSRGERWRMLRLRRMAEPKLPGVQAHSARLRVLVDDLARRYGPDADRGDDDA